MLSPKKDVKSYVLIQAWEKNSKKNKERQYLFIIYGIPSQADVAAGKAGMLIAAHRWRESFQYQSTK